MHVACGSLYDTSKLCHMFRQVSIVVCILRMLDLRLGSLEPHLEMILDGLEISEVAGASDCG